MLSVQYLDVNIDRNPMFDHQFYESG